MDEQSLPPLDRAAYSIVSLDEADDDMQYWLSKTPAERLEAIEINRRMVYGYDQATSRLQRVLEIAELERG